MEFILEHTDPSGARAGRIITDHGEIETPIFMPVGTVGSVKAVWPKELMTDINADIILGNTYHLYLRPGLDVLSAAGGLHPFMNWERPILTDSGGYQVFSLSDRRKLTEEGATFQSHIDGSYHTFTPENVVDTQRTIGSDIMMVLDECPPGDSTQKYASDSNELTIRWAERCKRRFEETTPHYGASQSLFGIVQGVVYPEIRRRSARQLMDIDFPGYAIGGLSVGEPAEQMYAMVDLVAPHPSQRQTTLSDGSRNAHELDRKCASWYRYVRLRNAHTQWKEWDDVHYARCDKHQECQVEDRLLLHRPRP